MTYCDACDKAFRLLALLEHLRQIAQNFEPTGTPATNFQKLGPARTLLRQSFQNSEPTGTLSTNFSEFWTYWNALRQSQVPRQVGRGPGCLKKANVLTCWATLSRHRGSKEVKARHARELNYVPQAKRRQSPPSSWEYGSNPGQKIEQKSRLFRIWANYGTKHSKAIDIFICLQCL